ncbi:MAG TPA: sensor histidine kinase [Anaerolineales bacterium]|nr:sensor histidine kinase [Anaerolineales bacterium]
MSKIHTAPGNSRVHEDRPSADRPSQWIFNLVASFYFTAVFLRSILVYRDRPELGQILGILLLWLLLGVTQPLISPRWSYYFPFYLTLQTLLVFVLLSSSDLSDFFAALLIILSMQVMLHLSPRVGGLWIGLCALIMVLLFARAYQAQAVALSLIYTAGNVLLGSYALATRRAQAARNHNQELAHEIQAANQQLQTYVAQLEGMAVARERNRLARELHDSVTQTVFSMTLTSQSAGLLLKRDPARVGAQLEHLNKLAQSALAEIQVLVSTLKPERIARGELVPALRQYLTGSRFQEELSVSLEVEGDQPLKELEEQSLFRIAQEALNNTLKHAQVPCAQVRLHLVEPFWMEIEDQGRGFDLQQTRSGGGIGLTSMDERAAEIGWGLQITTSPGAGTRIRVEKKRSAERQG